MGQIELEQGAKQAVEGCVKVQPHDRVVIVTDQETRRVGEALAAAAKKITPELQLFVMEDFGPRPADGSTPLAFPDSLKKVYEWATVSFFAAQGKKGELQSFRRVMCALVDERRIRHAHLIGVTEEMMGQGMAVDYAEVRRVSKQVYDVVHHAREIHVATKAGADFVAQFDPQIRWVIADGDITPEKWGNLPDGEVFTSPKTLDGHVVIDGVLGDFFSKKYGLIEKTPLSFDVKGGRVLLESLHCANTELHQEFSKYLRMDDNASRVGEFAIGTNVGLKKLIGNLLQDEKFPGIHIAVGNPYPEKTGATWWSDAHCDGVLKKTTIIVDGRTIMKEGTFTL